MFNWATRVGSPYPDSDVSPFINVPDVYCPADRATIALRTPRLLYREMLSRRVTPPSVTKQEKCYDPRDPTLRFVDKEDDLDFLCEGFKSLRAQMSCGHAVTPTSLTKWCRKLLDQGESRFVCGGSDCRAEWTFEEVCKMALLDHQEAEYFRRTMEFNAARQRLTTKSCPGCSSAVTRENGSDLNVLCKVCTAVKGQPFEFCWQCLREWKGARPRKDRCGNHGCCNPSLETLKKCPNISFDSVKECPSVRACPICGLLLEHSQKLCKNVDCPRCCVTFCFSCLNCFDECWMTGCTPSPRQTSIPVWKKE